MDSTGQYLKTICTVYYEYTQTAARTTCAAYGMQLYRIVNPDDETALMQYSNSQIFYKQLWIEGGKNSTMGLTVSNKNMTSFAKRDEAISKTFYFYCEFEGENFNFFHDAQ